MHRAKKETRGAAPEVQASVVSPQADAFVCQAVQAYLTKSSVDLLPPDPALWPRIGQTVGVHGLEGVMQQALREMHAAIPAPLQQQWHERSMGVLLENLRSLRVAVHLFALLEEAGIPAVAMRGLSLAHREYLSPGMRSMGDIDLLIRRKDGERLLQMARTHGLHVAQILRSQYVLVIEGVRFEVHWSFLTAKRYRRILRSETLLASRQPLETPDGIVYRLGAEYELIGLITHACIHHELMVVKQLVDIGLYLVREDFDWETVEKWSRVAGVQRMFALSGHLVASLFGLEQTGFHQVFGAEPAAWIARSLPRYQQYYFGGRNLHSHLTMKANLLRVAEGPGRKTRQLLGLLTLAELRELLVLVRQLPRFSGDRCV